MKATWRVFFHDDDDGDDDVDCDDDDDDDDNGETNEYNEGRNLGRSQHGVAQVALQGVLVPLGWSAE